MSEIFVALISGAMALLGVALSSFVLYKTEKRREKAEKSRWLRERRDETYRLISEYILIETENIHNQRRIAYQVQSTEYLVKQIEINMKLYVPTKIRRLFYSANEGIQSELPGSIVIERLDVLEDALREDVGLED